MLNLLTCVDLYQLRRGGWMLPWYSRVWLQGCLWVALKIEFMEMAWAVTATSLYHKPFF